MKTNFAFIFYSIVLFLQVAVVDAAVVIQYHHVDSATPAATSVAPGLFAQHMNYLSESGFQVWPLPRLIKSIQAEEALPEKVIAITFDDGYQSVYQQALPVLQKHQFPFTVFINSQLVGRAGYMIWPQLRELAAQGNTIANHTATHPHMVRLLDKETETHWKGRMTQEIVEVEQMLEKKLGTSPQLLAYPYGEYDHRVEKIVRKLNMIGFAQHSAAFDQRVDWQAIPRFALGGQYTDLKSFIEKVNSLPMPITSVSVTDGRERHLIDPLLPLEIKRPTLTLHLPSASLAAAVNCYASGQGRIEVVAKGKTVTTRPGHDLPVGRSRINCTASSEQKGRFYWYSAFFMRKQPDGQWYAEP